MASRLFKTKQTTNSTLKDFRSKVDGHQCVPELEAIFYPLIMKAGDVHRALKYKTPTHSYKSLEGV